METLLSFVLMALVASMLISTPMVFADAKLDSLVNLAMQARSQVKIQLDRSQNVSDNTKALYEQGNQQTELLVTAVKQGNVEEAKQRFLTAMRIFRQITQTFSEAQQEVIPMKSTPTQTLPIPEFNYENAIKRIENTVNMLKISAARNNLPVDFSKIDGLLQLAKTSIENGDTPTLEKSYTELKNAISEMQNTIKELTTQRSNDRAKSFVNNYIAKIDTILSKAKELNLSDEDVSKLNKIKEELASANDPNQIIIKIKRYSITINTEAAQPKQIRAAETEKLQTEETTESPKSADAADKPRESKNQKLAAELTQLEDRLAQVQPYVDENIKSKFDRAISLLSKLKSLEITNTDYNKTVKMVDILLDQMERYVKSLDSTSSTQDKNQNIGSELKRPSKKDQ